MLCVYVPAHTKTKCEFLENMAITIPSGWLVMITGDFNCVISEDNRVSSTQRIGMERSSRQLQQLVEDHSLADVGKGAQSPRGHFTWVYLQGKPRPR